MPARGAAAKNTLVINLMNGGDNREFFQRETGKGQSFSIPRHLWWGEDPQFKVIGFLVCFFFFLILN